MHQSHSRVKMIIKYIPLGGIYGQNMWFHVTDLMAKVQLKVITQIKTLGDGLGMIWLHVVSSQKGYFGG